MTVHKYPHYGKGRSSGDNPPNRFEPQHTESDWEQLADVDAAEQLQRAIPTEFLPDASQSIIASNQSPDVPFELSINPYRGCEHGCAYCYARPYHEYLGFGAGIDFETKILVKHAAPALLRAALCSPTWRVRPIALSGVTDCYQPAERQFRLTRGCLEVLLEAKHPVTIITKNALVLRDLELLEAMAARNLVQVALSVTTLDDGLARSMEPRTSSPAARLAAISRLRQAGVPAMVMNAPIIPGLNDHEMYGVLSAARDAGAQSAGYVLLRMPLSVEPVFIDWLQRTLPDRLERVLSYVRSTRGGGTNDPRFGSRMRGEGVYAEQLATSFRVFRAKLGLDQRLPELDVSQFVAPDCQGRLF